MKNDIKTLLADYEKYHSVYQIENFIIGGQGNAWAKYKQCLREIKSRRDNIESMRDERELLLLDIKSMKRKRWFRGKLSRARDLIKLKSSQRKIKDIDECLYHISRELIYFVNLAKRIKKESWGDKIISGDLRKKLEAQMWLERVKQMMAVDILSFGAVSKPTIEMLFNMPKEERKELFKMIEPNNRGGLIEWALM